MLGKVGFEKFTQGVFGFLGISSRGAAAENWRFEGPARWTARLPWVVAEFIVSCLNPITNPLISPCNRRLVDIIVINMDFSEEGTCSNHMLELKQLLQNYEKKDLSLIYYAT